MYYVLRTTNYVLYRISLNNIILLNVTNALSFERGNSTLVLSRIRPFCKLASSYLRIALSRAAASLRSQSVQSHQSDSSQSRLLDHPGESCRIVHAPLSLTSTAVASPASHIFPMLPVCLQVALTLISSKSSAVSHASLSFQVARFVRTLSSSNTSARRTF